jgi:hypothetical protein
MTAHLAETVRTVYRWSNGMVMVFGEDGEQIAHLQGRATPGRLQAIRQLSDRDTKWHGFDEDGPLDWDTGWPSWRRLDGTVLIAQCDGGRDED